MAEASDARAEILRAAASFYARGWMAGTAGNLSVRADEATFWITASGKDKGRLSAADLVRVDRSGQVVERAAAAERPSAETSIHRAVYECAPNVGAVYHVHTVAAVVVSRLPTPLRLPPLEVLKGFGIVDPASRPLLPVLANHLEVPRIAEALREMLATPLAIPAVLIADHGMTVWGERAEDAFHHVELLEHVLQTMLTARHAGIDL